MYQTVLRCLTVITFHKSGHKCLARSCTLLQIRHVCMHAYIHTYIHTCIHAYIYIYIYIYASGRYVKSFLFLIQGAIAASGYYYINKPFHIFDLNCTGKEETIWNCSHNGLLNYNCPFTHDATIRCQSK